MKYGPRHGNYHHGDDSIKAGLAKDLLIRVMTTPCDGRGELPFTQEEQQWALRVVRERPEWAKQTLKNLGFKEN